LRLYVFSLFLPFTNVTCDTDGDIETESRVSRAEDSDIAVLSLVSDFNAIQDSSTVSATTDNGSLISTWPDGSQVCTLVMILLSLGESVKMA